MRKSRNIFENRIALAGLLATLVLISVSMLTAALPQDGAPGEAKLGSVTFEIVDVTFVKEYQGANNNFETQDEALYRGAIMTVEVKKKAGEGLTLYGPDYSLHYFFGDSHDVVPCNGISGFSTAKDTDRPMTFFGGGYGRTNTGLATTKAKKIYVDFFFQDLEPAISDVYLFVGQPTGVAFASGGWE